MFMPGHKADKDVQLTALRRYMKRKIKLSELMRYAKLLKVEKGMRPYLEVLLDNSNAIEAKDSSSSSTKEMDPQLLQRGLVMEQFLLL